MRFAVEISYRREINNRNRQMPLACSAAISGAGISFIKPANFKSGEGRHRDHAAQRKHRVIAPLEGHEFVEPGRRLFVYGDTAAEDIIRDAEGVVVIVLRDGIAEIIDDPGQDYQGHENDPGLLGQLFEWA